MKRKKVAFAIHVFGLIAMFPVWLVAELNYATEQAPVKDKIEILEDQTIRPVLIAEKVKENTVVINGQNEMFTKIMIRKYLQTTW